MRDVRREEGDDAQGRELAVAEPKLPSFLDDLDDEPVAIVQAEVVDMVAPEDAQEALRAIEDELLKKSLGIVESALDFVELDPENNDEVPQEWIDELGEAEAVKRHRVARAGWLNAKEAPVAMKLAKDTAMGIVKARATDKLASRPLSVQVLMPAPMRDYSTKDVE